MRIYEWMKACSTKVKYKIVAKRCCIYNEFWAILLKMPALVTANTPHELWRLGYIIICFFIIVSVFVERVGSRHVLYAFSVTWCHVTGHMTVNRNWSGADDGCGVWTFNLLKERNDVWKMILVLAFEGTSSSSLGRICEKADKSHANSTTCALKAICIIFVTVL